MAADILNESVSSWTIEDVEHWLCINSYTDYAEEFKSNRIDGRVLLILSETDLTAISKLSKCLGDLKKLWLDIRDLQLMMRKQCDYLILDGCNNVVTYNTSDTESDRSPTITSRRYHYRWKTDVDQLCSKCGTAHTHEKHRSKMENHYLVSDRFKAVLAFSYALVAFFVSAIVMTIVHDRVPDKRTYPPLPDIVLDNIPVIPYAFQFSEIIALTMFFTLAVIAIFHKYRFVIIRRICCISGSVFLLRCMTMFVTSLSIPGRHLDCESKTQGDITSILHRAWEIWSGLGMTVAGVRTCGDYLFSGHTVAVTLCNFFITEYTPDSWSYFHFVSWTFNLSGIFFILAAHEHYSIDVLIAYYVSTRLFVYYHALANACIARQRKNERAFIYIPLFMLFEDNVVGPIPNVFEWPFSIQWTTQRNTKSKKKKN